MTKISIIIPAKNEEKYLPKCLNNLLVSINEVNIDFEIIVVADSCVDKTSEIAQHYNCKVINVDFKNRSKTRNAGFAISTGNVIVFIDADTIVSNSFIKKTLDTFKKSKKSVIYYNQKQIEKSTISNLYFKLINFIGNFRPSFTPAISCLRPYFCENQFDNNLKSLEDLMFMTKAHRLKESFFCDSTVYTSIRRYSKFGFIYSFLLFFRSLINPYKYEWKPIN